MSQSDRFTFDYNQLDIGPTCATLGWIHQSHSCRPATFVIEGFALDDIRANRLDAPRLSFNSTSPSVTFPTSQIVEEIMYFKIYVTDDNGILCNIDSISANTYYQLDIRSEYTCMLATEEVMGIRTLYPQHTQKAIVIQDACKKQLIDNNSQLTRYGASYLILYRSKKQLLYVQLVVVAIINNYIGQQSCMAYVL